MAKLPYLRLYVGDALSDDKLVGLSLSAWGAWIKVLFLMWKAQESPMQKTRRAWCNVFNCTEEELDAVVAELAMNDVGHMDSTDQFISFHSPRIAADILKVRSDRERKRTERATDTTPTRGTPSDPSDPVAAFFRVTGYNPPAHFAERITREAQNVGLLEAVCQRWIDSGYRRQNVTGILDMYAKELEAAKQNPQGKVVAMCVTCNTKPRSVGAWCQDCHDKQFK